MVKKAVFGRIGRAASSNERRGKGERGAALVEFALVAPLFFAVVFGGIEMGLMFRSYLALENVTRATARVASIQRDAPTADNVILDQIAQRAAPLQGDVTKIVIFNAESLDGEVPQFCLAGSVSNVCNSYEITDGDVATVAAGSTESGWDGPQRASFDNIGIYIEYDYQFATGFFDSLTLSSTTVEVIELDL